MIGTRQWVGLLEQQYATTSGRAGLDLLLATRKFVKFLEGDPRSQRYVGEISNAWGIRSSEWLSDCDEIRHELHSLQLRIREVGARIEKYVEGTHGIPDQDAFDRSKYILERIKEVDWFQSWAGKTDDLNLDLLHIARPDQTQTGHMAAHVLSISRTLVRLATALAIELESSQELNRQAERLWGEYRSAQIRVKNDWMSSGECALEQLRVVVSIMDGDIFIDPENLMGSKVRPLMPWALLLVMYAPPNLQREAEYRFRQPEATNRDFEKDVEPLVRLYLQQVFTELQFLAKSDTASKIQPDSILIATATKAEAQAVLEAFSQAAGERWTRQAIGNKTYYDLGIHGGAPVYMVQSESGTAVPGGALLTVRQAIQDLRPQAVIMCGFAFGLRPDKQQLGDILVAKQLLSYEPQKVDLQRGKIPRGDRTTSADRLLDRFRSGDHDWQGAPTHFGLVLSSEKLINDPAFRDQLLKAEPDAIGGEMEGAGLYVAARDAGVEWILVKAICDWGDGKKDDAAQPLAARNAAQFVLHVLQLGGWDRPE